MLQIKRGSAVVAEVLPLTSSTVSRAVMGEESITLAYEVPQYTELLLGDYIVYEGARWKLNSLPTVKKASTTKYRVDAKFESGRYDLSKTMYLLFDSADVPPKGEFTLTGEASLFVELLVANLNRVADGLQWHVGGVIADTPHLTLSFCNEDCLTVLSRLADEFDTEYHIIGDAIHLERRSTERPVTLQYGSTLYDIERSAIDSSSLCTRLYPYGSTNNLPTDYRGGNMPLCLPESVGQYLEKNTALYGIIENSKTFDEIYPRLELCGAGVVTDVASPFVFSDGAIDFNVNDCLLAGTPAKVHFTTGQCAGYDFEIKSFNFNTRTFTIIAVVDENDFTLPTSDLRPEVGDKYVLLDVVMPSYYRTAAEQELRLKALEWMNEHAHPKVSYKCTFNKIFAKQNVQLLECGDTVRLVDSELGIDEQIRIVKLTKGLTEHWNMQIDLSNTVTKTTLERIAGDIATLQNNVVVSNERINRNTMRSYQQSKELREMVFDTDGYFDPENIKPLSIETSMLSVGAKSQSFQLSCLLQPNYGGNANVLNWTAGTLAHFTINDASITEWLLPAGSITLTEGYTNTALYIYARCPRNGSNGVIHLTTDAVKFDADAADWYFLLGVLHNPIDGVRGISLTYGQTTINGQFITTGVIRSLDGATYFNLNNGEIGGNIKFKSSPDFQSLQIGGANLVSNGHRQQDLEIYGNEYIYFVNGSANIKIKPSTTYILSFDVACIESTYDNRIQVSMAWISNHIIEVPFNDYYKKQRVSVVFTTPELLPNEGYYGVAFRAFSDGIFIVNDVKIEVGDIPTAYMPSSDDVANAIAGSVAALDYLKVALADSTDIIGGLLMTNLLMLKNNLGVICAGISGINDDKITLWGGGTYAQAIAAAASGDGSLPILLTKAGIGSNIGIFKVLEDSILVDKNERKVYVTTKSISDSDIVGEPVTLYYGGNKTFNAGKYTLALNGGTVTINASATLYPSIEWSNGIITPAGGYNVNVTLYVCFGSEEIQIGSGNCSCQYPMGGTGNQNVSNSATFNLSSSTYQRTFAAATLVKFKIEVVATFSGTGGTNGSHTETVNNTYLYITEQKRLTLIGSDGFAITLGSTQQFTVQEVENELQMKFKGKLDIPGVLLSGRGLKSGGGSDLWGKTHPTRNVEKESTGTYRVYHSIGHAQYSVVVTPMTTNLTFCVTGLASSYFTIIITTVDGAPYDSGFNFVVLGGN